MLKLHSGKKVLTRCLLCAKLHGLEACASHFASGIMEGWNLSHRHEKKSRIGLTSLGNRVQKKIIVIIQTIMFLTAFPQQHAWFLPLLEAKQNKRKIYTGMAKYYIGTYKHCSW